MSMYDQTLRGFLKEAASKAPTPGGGSVAAVAAALGASMGSMVARLTQGPRFAAVQAEMTDLAERMERAIAELEHVLQQDIDAFGQYMAALGLPKASEEEKALRSKAMEAAAERSAEVPLGLMRQCSELMQSLADILDKANKNVISDLAIAMLMLEAAVQSAWITVEINLSGIKAEGVAEEYRERGLALISQCQSLKMDALHRVRLIIQG